MRHQNLVCSRDDSQNDLRWQYLSRRGQYLSRRGRRRFIISLAGVLYIVLILDQWRFHSSSIAKAIDDSRRLTEVVRGAQSPRERPQIPLRPWLDPPAPKITGQVWNATNIQWVGTSFHFPQNGHSFQLYTPHQIQKAFRKHSILLQGDSTVRRLYGSFHSILSHDVWTGSTSIDFPKGFPSQVPHPPFGIPASYFARRGLDSQAAGFSPSILLSQLIHSPAPIDPRLLEHRTIVDANKDFYTEPCHRLFPPSYIMHTPSGIQTSDNISLGKNDSHINAATTFKSSRFEYKVCRLLPTGGWLPPTSIPKGTPNLQRLQLHPTRSPLLYDYTNTNCLGHIHDFVTHELSYQQSITRQHSLYVVGPGVWETVKQSACHHPLFETLQSSHGQTNQLVWPDTVYQLQQETLEKLSMLAEQSPELFIVWRTSGYYDGDVESHVIKEMNRQALEFIHDWNSKRRRQIKGSRSNFLCMDFGAAVEHISHGRKRLRGDMQAHYGLEVRILQVQMLTNLLYEHGYVS